MTDEQAKVICAPPEPYLKWREWFSRENWGSIHRGGLKLNSKNSKCPLHSTSEQDGHRSPYLYNFFLMFLFIIMQLSLTKRQTQLSRLQKETFHIHLPHLDPLQDLSDGLFGEVLS